MHKYYDNKELFGNGNKDGNLINTVQYFYGQIHGDWTRYYKSLWKNKIYVGMYFKGLELNGVMV